MRIRSCVVCVLMGLLISAAAFAADSAMFRGNPQLTGVYAAAPVMNVDGVRFAFHTAGPIRATPAIVGGTAYFGSSDGNFYAIDSHTGAERWHVKTGGAITSSAAVVGDNVYFASRDGMLYALATNDGSARWKFTFGHDLGAQNYWDYYLSSPVVVNGTLYIGSGDGNLYALDAATSNVRWKSPVDSRIRSTPAVSGDAIVFGTMSGHVIAVDAQTGKQRWKFATKGASNKFADKGNDTTSIFASPTIANGMVVVGGRDGNIYGIDLATGKQAWQTTHDGSSWILSTAAADGTVYIGSGSARIVQAAQIKTGKEVWRFAAKDAVFSSLTIARDMLYFGDFSGNVNAVSRTTGKLVWRYPLGGRILSTPVIDDGIVYCSSDTGDFVALDSAPAKTASESARRIVYFEGKKSDASFSWFVNDVDASALHYFKSIGYEQLDAAQLAEFMKGAIVSHVRSVVVFADNKMPASIAETNDANALVRRYLDAGGKAVVFGPNPLAFRADPATGEVTEIDFTIPQKIFGIDYFDPGVSSGFYMATPTADGQKWGLRGATIVFGTTEIPPAQASTVLAHDEFGQAALWIKNFGGPKGTGLLQLSLPRNTPADIAPLLPAIEYGLY